MSDSPALTGQEMRSTLSTTGNVFKTPRRGNYTTVPNEIVKHEHLSLEARGLLLVVLSLPPDFDVRQAYLLSQARCGKDKLQGILRELTKYGYLRRSKQFDKDSSGKFTSYYQFFDTAIDSPWRENRDGSAATGNAAIYKNKGNKKKGSNAPKRDVMDGDGKNGARNHHPLPPPAEVSGPEAGGGTPSLVPDPATCKHVITAISNEIARFTEDGKDLPTEVRRTAKAIAVRKDWQVEPARKAIVTAWEMLPVCTVANLRTRLGL